MTAAAKSYSIWNVEMEVVSRLDVTFEKFKSKIKNTLFKGEISDKIFDDMIPFVFDLRMKGINIIEEELSGKNKKYSEGYSSLIDKIEKLFEDEVFDCLAQNVCYALSISNIIFKNADTINGKKKDNIRRDSDDKFSFSDFNDTIELLPIPESNKKDYYDLMYASLVIELMVISINIIIDEKIILTQKVANSLAKVVKENTQVYVTLTTKFGMLPTYKSNDEDFEFDEEHMDLAELGLDEFDLVFNGK